MVSPETHRRAVRLFGAACRLDERERASFLDDACAGDAELRAEVESLLRHDAGPAAFFESGARAPSPSVPLPDAIGGYRILGVLGAGGMGIVYLAEQQQPRRPVALKVMRPGLASDRLVRRFEHEVLALGRLQHPGIAQIFDAGTAPTSDGPRPYLAMERVDGLPLTDHARQWSLDRRARLELLVEVCDAVQHAHRKGVVHRDLKPGNILVDAAGRPKVLDFGIARVLDPDLPRVTFDATTPLPVGTLPYMSPEQLRDAGADADTRSDVHALAVIGYELLTGRLPHDLEGASLPEAARILRDDAPVPPASVDPSLRGDLDVILRKGLEKDPARRYPTPADLAADVLRHLRGEPIASRPPGAVEQLGRFARRHRLLVSAAALVLLTASAGMVAVTTQWLRAREAEARTRREAESFREILGYLREMFGAANPEQLGRDATVLQVVDLAVRGLDDALAGRPEAREMLRATFGDLESGLGRYERAEEMLVTARERLAERLGADHPETLRADAALATLRVRTSRFEEAEAAARRVLAVRRADPAAGAGPVVAARNVLASVLIAAGRTREAAAVIEPLAEEAARALGGDDPETVRARMLLAMLRYRQGRHEESRALHEALIHDVDRSGGADHPFAQVLRQRQMAVLLGLGRVAEAESLGRELLAVRERVLGPAHPATLATRLNIGSLLQAVGRVEEAAAHYEDLLARQTGVLAEDHADRIATKSNYAATLDLLGWHDRAAGLWEEVLAAHARVLAEDHPDRFKAESAAVYNLGQRGEIAEALVRMDAILRAMESRLGPEHRDRAQTMAYFASLLDGWNRHEEAADHWDRVAAVADRVWPEGHPDRYLTASSRAVNRFLRGDAAAAERDARAALEEAREAIGEDHPKMALLRGNLAEIEQRAQGEQGERGDG